MRIIDCFPFFNEKELLELRINLLYDKVDQFIICDANKTHSGKEKQFTCKKIIEELNLSTDKIHVIEVDLPSYEEEDNAWIRERMQRNAASNLIQDEDICIVSDCDEIINPDFVTYYASIVQQHPNNILRIPMAFLNCRADLRLYNPNNEPILWAAPFLCTKNHLQKYTLSDIRESYALSTNHIEFSDIFATENGKIQDAGWHFGWMGDKERLKIKNESFLHWNEVSVKENFIAKENSTDCLGRHDHILKKYPIENLPTKIWELPRVKNFLFAEDTSSDLNLDTEREKILEEVGQNNFFNWGGHRKFAEWIVKEINPEVIVDLGVDYGYSSFCFSLPNIGNVYGIDCFEGDNHAGKRDTYEYVLSKKEELQINNLTIIKGYFEDIAKTWDKQIDILHIDGFHTYEAVKNDFETWIKFLSPNGIILMHDTMVENPTFGVSKFFNEIKLPKTNFKNSNGLGIVSYDQKIIDKIKDNFSECIFEFDKKPQKIILLKNKSWNFNEDLKTLTIIIGNPRGGEETWNSMYKNLLDPYNSDLALCFGQREDKNSSLYQRAKYVWELPEYENWREYYNQHCSNYWEKSLILGKDYGVTGGIDDYEGSGSIIFAFRHFIKNNYKHILKQYDRIILTRSDFYYMFKHPILSNDYFWIPEGENYGGISDRHHIFPSTMIDEILGIVEFLDTQSAYENLMNVDSNKHKNTEMFLRLLFEEHKIIDKIKRFPRVQFTVCSKGDETRWKKGEKPLPSNHNLMLKYVSEYEDCIKNGLENKIYNFIG